jgi:hypothetical protein
MSLPPDEISLRDFGSPAFLFTIYISQREYLNMSEGHLEPEK